MDKVIDVQRTDIATTSAEVPALRSAASVTPMEMLDRALSSGASVETLTQLMNLQERWEASQARKAFDSAIAQAKAEIPPIIRNATGHNNKRYADFSAIASVVDPILSKYGLSYRFKTSQTDKINVTCILSHKEGHAEETTLSGGADTSGSKNAIQAIGSALTYLSRYSLMAALGLAATNDDDGARSGDTADDAKTITDVQAGIIRELVEKAELTNDQFCAHWKIEAVTEIHAAKFNDVVGSLRRRIAAIAERNKEPANV